MSENYPVVDNEAQFLDNVEDLLAVRTHSACSRCQATVAPSSELLPAILGLCVGFIPALAPPHFKQAARCCILLGLHGTGVFLIFACKGNRSRRPVDLGETLRYLSFYIAVSAILWFV